MSSASGAEVEATGRSARSKRLRRRLLMVLLCDAAAVTTLGAVASVTRSHPSGPVFSSIAGTAAASLAPGVIAVAREGRAHRTGAVVGHHRSPSVILFSAGLVINTVGTVFVLVGPRSRRAGGRAEVAVAIALLIGGDAIGWPYLSLTRALHR